MSDPGLFDELQGHQPAREEELRGGATPAAEPEPEPEPQPTPAPAKKAAK